MRPLPIINIAGTDFFIDLRRMELREIANPVNRITFYDLREDGDHLLLLYDTRTRNAYHGPGRKLTECNKLKIIRLRPLQELDPFTYALLQARHDTRLDLLKRAARLLDPPSEASPTQHHKLK